jgi:hypothetical protein
MHAAASTIGRLCGAIGLITLATTPALAQLDRGLTPAPCSVLSGHPCHPSFCSVFHHGPCLPQYPPPIGQDLRLTIAATEEKLKDKPATDRSEDQFVNTLQEMFRALGACWPPAGKSQPGMEYTVRFAFKANGELMGPPRGDLHHPRRVRGGPRRLSASRGSGAEALYADAFHKGHGRRHCWAATHPALLRQSHRARAFQPGRRSKQIVETFAHCQAKAGNPNKGGCARFQITL